MGGENVVMVTIFGKFTVSYRDEKISERVAPVENQSWQLLKYLLVNAGRVVTTKEITRELTLTGREDDVLNTLRVRLRRSRILLEGIGLGSAKSGLIMYGDGQFWINRDYRIETDQQKIDQCYISMADQKTPRSGRLDEYMEGLACFGGHYLENSRNSPWISEARAHYDKVYLQLLDRCMETMAETGDFSRVDAVWNSALRIKPRELAVHEKLLRGLIHQNRIAQAATYYSKLAVQLANTGLELPEFTCLMNEPTLA